MKRNINGWGKATIAALALSAMVTLFFGCGGIDLGCDGDCYVTDGQLESYDWGTRSDCDAYAREQADQYGGTWWVKSWDSYC